jgi:hypothetical protein
MRCLLAGLLVVLCVSCASETVKPQPVQPPGTPAAVVWIRGDVKHEVVPWTEDLTLARAIVAAEYKGLGDPHAIFVVRHGQTYKISPRELLRGRDDPPLEAGDMIVIER